MGGRENQKRPLTLLTRRESIRNRTLSSQLAQAKNSESDGDQKQAHASMVRLLSALRVRDTALAKSVPGHKALLMHLLL